jgi:hypothetical protein
MMQSAQNALADRMLSVRWSNCPDRGQASDQKARRNIRTQIRRPFFVVVGYLL